MFVRPLLAFLFLALPLSAQVVGLPESTHGAPATGVPALRTETDRTAMFIELTAEPAAVVYARARERAFAKGAAAAEAAADSAAAAQLAVIEAEQKPILDALRNGDAGGTFLYAVQRVGNGIAAELSAEDAARVAKLPGVRRLVPLAPMVPELSSSVALIGAPALWSPSTGSSFRGEGMRIGIIDSGVDYLHADLGGPGVYSRTDFTRADVPWNAKVAGGTDLAGDDYDSSSADATKHVPHPDPDPMDCSGHGTHVAGIAAGNGVRADGTAFNGPYGATIDPNAFRIGPGVAPLAKLYAIRIFGCSGSTMLQAAALDWAVDPNRDGNLSDHLDVVNLSIGAMYGWFYDPTAITAADNAALAGTIVVAASGNDGDMHFITSAPGAAARALSVAASDDSTDTYETFVVTAPASLAGSKPALLSSAYDWWKMTSALTAVVAYPPSQRSGCEAFAPATAALLSGKIALLDWDAAGCKSSVRVANAAAAGAAGVLFAYEKERIDIGISGTSQVPAMIVPKSVADAIKAALPVTVKFDPQLLGTGATRIVDQSLVDTMAELSSRGPRVGDSLLKPDLAAPGMSIYSARYHGGSLGMWSLGTSMATPHVAGGMALLKQMHPSWSVEELKALAMNSATNDVYCAPSQGTPVYAPPRAGAGRFSLADAAITDILAYAVDDPGSVGISFGQLEVTGTLSAERQFRVVNKSSSAAVVTLAYTPIVAVSGVSFDFPGGTTLTVPANGSVVARLRLTADASQLKHRHDPASEEKQGGYSRYWLTEATGRIDLMRGFEPIRLPVHAIVRPASTMTAAKTPVDLRPQSGKASIALSGTSFNTGSAYPEDWVSLVTPFELHETHDRKPSIDAALNLRYVGATSNYRTESGSLAGTVIYFGIAAYGPSSSPGQRYTEIRIDVNGDGKSDYVLYTSSGARFLTGDGANDVFVTAICPVPAPALPSANCSSRWLNDFAPADADTNVFNTDVVRYALPASRIGLTAGHSLFRYRVVTYDGSTAADSTAWLPFDPAHSLSLFSTLPSGMFFDRATNPLQVEWSAGDTTTARGILLLHYFNAPGTRAEVVPVVTATGKRRAVTH